jgi:HD-GYP domain-containing protein (c-di-GMP phosphodiesterase class II)
MSETNTTSTAAPSPMPASVLDNLAGRVRPVGLCLMMVSPDGQILFRDSGAGTFFLRYVLPWINSASPEATSRALVQNLGRINVESGVEIWDCIPGVCLAAFPCVERRQLIGVFILAGRSPDFASNAAVPELCARLGIDVEWIQQQARPLLPQDPQSMERKARLMLTMVRDQTQLSHLQSELDSLSAQLGNTYEELSLIYQISSGMRINRQADEFFKQACLEMLQVMEVRGMGVALCGDHAARQNPVVFGQISLPPGTVQRLAEELPPILRQRNAPVQFNDLQNQGSFSWLGGHVRRMLAVPMLRQDQLLGFYFALDKRDGDFDSQDSKMLNSIANESAIFLENAMLYDDMHGLMMGLLHSLTSAVDAKDPYTLGHSERVAALGRQLTLEAGLGDALAERVYLAGLLHDVGKIGVPESVLHKTGRLTAEEFEQMKKHPQIGGRILADVKQIRDLIPGVMHHHERYDGHGYPHGLAGENIPLMGRLICLADCFDAMTSNRTYRKAMPLEVALTEIRRCGGTQFDPGLTEAFLRIGSEKLRELVLLPQRLAGVSGSVLLGSPVWPAERASAEAQPSAAA